MNMADETAPEDTLMFCFSKIYFYIEAFGTVYSKTVTSIFTVAPCG